MTTSNLCPCGSQQSIDSCCLPFIQGKKQAATAEALLRARYTAFTLGEVDFILNTHHSKTREQVNRGEIEDWAKNSKWLGLEILGTREGQTDDSRGLVSFKAHYQTNDTALEHGEHALFEKENNQWRFLDAQPLKSQPIVREEPKTGRNDPCPCGSGKKHKKCCG